MNNQKPIGDRMNVSDIIILKNKRKQKDEDKQDEKSQQSKK